MKPKKLADASPIDRMLSLTEASEWLSLSKRILLRRAKGRRPIIPGFRLSRKEWRFHPRTIIAKLAKDAGVDRETITDSLATPAIAVDKQLPPL